MSRLWGLVAVIICLAWAIDYFVSIIRPLAPFIIGTLCIMAIGAAIYHRMTRW